MIAYVRRRTQRTLVAYSWNEKTGIAKRRFEGAGGPPTMDEVFHGLCFLDQETKDKIRRYL